jgi:hypothetical protein
MLPAKAGGKGGKGDGEGEGKGGEGAGGAGGGKKERVGRDGSKVEEMDNKKYVENSIDPLRRTDTVRSRQYRPFALTLFRRVIYTRVPTVYSTLHHQRTLTHNIHTHVATIYTPRPFKPFKPVLLCYSILLLYNTMVCYIPGLRTSSTSTRSVCSTSSRASRWAP